MSKNVKSTSDQNLIDFSDDTDPNSPATILELFDPIHETILERPVKDITSSGKIVKGNQNQDVDKKRTLIIPPPPQPTTNPKHKTKQSSKQLPNKHEIVVNGPVKDIDDTKKKRNSDIIVVPDRTNFELHQRKSILARKHQRSNLELALLTNHIKSFRAKFKFSDEQTNPGIIFSPTLNSPKIRDTSVKITITSPLALEPINFTCNASTTVEHLVSHAVCSMFDNLHQDDNMDNYMLKVTGKNEFIDSKLCLADYALVSHCWKFDLDVKLTLVRRKDINRPFARISQDDYRCKKLLCPDDLMSSKTILKFSDLNYESLDIIIQTFDREAERLYKDVTNRSKHIQTQSLLQTTKAICSLMMNCETSQLTESKNNLIELCKSYKDEGGHLLDEDRYKMIEVIQNAIRKLMLDMHRLLKVFSDHLPVDYEVVDHQYHHYNNNRKPLASSSANRDSTGSGAKSNHEQIDDSTQVTSSTPSSSFVDSPINLIRDQVSLKIQSINQLRPEWLSKYQDYHLRLTLMHGETTLCAEVATHIVRADTSLFQRLLFDQHLILSLNYCDLPRESRFVMTLYGHQIDNGSMNQQLQASGCQQSSANSNNNNPTTDGAINNNGHTDNYLTTTSGSSKKDDLKPLTRATSSNSISSTQPTNSTSPRSSFQRMQANPGQHKSLNGESMQQPIALAQSMAYLFDVQLDLKQGDGLLCLHPLDILDQNSSSISLQSQQQQQLQQQQQQQHTQLQQNLQSQSQHEIYEPIYIESIPDRQMPILMVEFRKFPPEKHIYFPNNDKQLKELSDMGMKKSDRTINGKNDDDDSVAKQQASTSATEKQSNLFDELDSGVKFVLRTIIYEKPLNERLLDDERQLLWDNRYNLVQIPEALPKVLASVPKWSCTKLMQVYELLDIWTPMNPIDSLQLLMASQPDSRIRQKAVQWISEQNDDELCDYLPQLLQTFRYEKSLDCPLLWLLLDRSMKNARIATLSYWQLKLNGFDRILEERCDILINCLLWLSGSAFWKSIDKQEKLLNILGQVSSVVKDTRDGQRQQVLGKNLERVQDFLTEHKPPMPWAPSLQICDLDLKNCSYFPSNTLPLKLCFRSAEIGCNQAVKFHNYETIFKAGDDLRQDMLAIHMIRLMEKLWLREGLDLRMVTFDCIATNECQGLVEMVQNSETLRKIHQNSSFLTGPFNPKAIDNYIRLWNTSELEYKTAVDKFLHSCAGYSVATYILGICDRHNDNIMVTTSGHLFHIDFGKFLGDAQMLGSIKRDRTPFVLTSDMAYVINGGDRPSKKFQTFIELCALAFNIIRRNRNIFINLFSLMASAKIHGVNASSVDYINKMLMPELSEIEAMAKFTRLIEDCLNSRSTQVNFFIHNLAQLKFSNDNSKQSLLSFVPKTFTMQTDGRIEHLDIVNMFKRYDPEKQYFYVVNLKRFGQPDPIEVYRTFSEFCELQIKLACMFPCNRFHDINRSSGGTFMDFVVRTNTREVAHRRLIELRIFVAALLRLPAQISHCDLIYTFFHPILRDQQSIHPAHIYANSANSSLYEPSTSSPASTFGSQEYTEAQRQALYLGSNGQVKCSLSYKNSSLIIMIMHAKNLACPEGLNGPNSYAKTYLLPDPKKQTKKRTRVIRQSCHPTYMELIVYKEPIAVLRKLTLQISIWHSELVSNKIFLGAAYIPLDKLEINQEKTSWYPLKNMK